jgi:signal transduction histidine kinase
VEEYMFIKTRSIRYIFLVFACIAIVMTAFNTYYVYPSFSNLLIDNTEDEALRLGEHLAALYYQGKKSLSTAEAKHAHKHAEEHFAHFGLMKLKLFGAEGKVIFSSDEKDIGKMNKKDYFHNIVAKGNPFTKFVEKNAETLEGQIVTVDVVETYVPVMAEGKFIGAFELYYDITDRYSKLGMVTNKSILLYFIMLFFAVIISLLMMKKLDASIIRQHEIEEDLKVFAGKLNRSNQELESFAHIASHDLQEPLRKVQAFGDRLRMKYGDMLGEQGLDYIERMQKASHRMQTLINSLLMYSRVTTKAKPFEQVDLGKLTHEVVTDLEVRIQETGGHVEVNELPTLDADPMQMRQLFQNLISNALKFNKEGTTPHVKLSAGPVDGIGSERGAHVEDEHYQIICEDNGIGFENKYSDRIFGVFQRLHGRNQYEGSGIGLSVCKKIVERHGGSIKAESSPGEGTKFIIDLPVKQGGE